MPPVRYLIPTSHNSACFPWTSDVIQQRHHTRHVEMPLIVP